MKINYYTLISRSLIALLFVLAGVQKIMEFKMMSGYAGSLVGVSSPTLAMIIGAIIIIIEVPVALAFAWGYRLCITGGLLAGFTALATILVHNPWSSNIGGDPMAFQMAMMMALKNISIIGGIMLAIYACTCGTCPVSKKKGHAHAE